MKEVFQLLLCGKEQKVKQKSDAEGERKRDGQPYDIGKQSLALSRKEQGVPCLLHVVDDVHMQQVDLERDDAAAPDCPRKLSLTGRTQREKEEIEKSEREREGHKGESVGNAAEEERDGDGQGDEPFPKGK